MKAIPKMHDVWRLFRDAGIQWNDDKAPRLGAALAYYSAFSLAPLFVIVIAITGLVFGREAAMGQISGQIEDLVGADGAKAVQAMIVSASKPMPSIFAAVVGVGMLLVGSLGLFGQLQDALNTIWKVEQKPGLGVIGFVRERWLSLTMVLGTALLLLISLVVNSVLAAIGGLLGEPTYFGEIVNFCVSLVVITMLFAMIYRYLPDVQISWHDVMFSSVVTALLFTLGKHLIGLYLGKSGAASAYGAAGSLAALLIWLYYTSQIFLYNAELTRAFAFRYGSRIQPKENAVAVDPKAVA